MSLVFDLLHADFDWITYYYSNVRQGSPSSIVGEQPLHINH
jgi:hypothetical protein